MYLGNPMLPVSLPVNEALQKLTKVITEKNWQNFEIGSMRLVLTPFFFYQYHYFLEEEKDSTKIVKETVDGFISLNGNLLKINENVARLIKNKLYDSNNNLAPEIEFIEQETNVTKKEQEKILVLKTAQHFKVPKENLIVSNIKLFLVPFYETHITIEKENYSIRMNAVDGNLHGIEKIPEREKGFLEITRETLDELTTPATWVNYTKEMFIDAKKSLVESKQVKKEKKEVIKSLDLSFLDSKLVLILIMILALFLIYLAFI